MDRINASSDENKSMIEEALVKLSELPVKVLQQLLLDMDEERDTYISHWADTRLGRRIKDHAEVTIMEKTVFK